MFTPGSVLILCLNFYVKEDGSYYTTTVSNNCLPQRNVYFTAMGVGGGGAVVNGIVHIYIVDKGFVTDQP